MDKIAVISDIHGNLVALREVLKDIKNRKIRYIICLGDIIAKGSNSNKCIDLIKENCYIVLQGNCDEYFCKNHDLKGLEEKEKKRIIWNEKLLSKENKEYLQNLKFSHDIYISGSLVRLFHASPTNNKKVVTQLDSIDKKLELFEANNKIKTNKNADIVIFGHIHNQFMNKLYNKTLINCGSVGNAFDLIRNEKYDSNTLETTNANYLIIEGNINQKNYGGQLNFNFIRLPYDIKEELKLNEDNIEFEEYKNELINGIYRDKNI